MTFTRWPDADHLIDAALDLSPDSRRVWLAELAGRNRELADAIAPVLAEADSPDPFLAPGAPLVGAVAADVFAADDQAALAPGDTVADFEILNLAGRGGMGEVYRARDRRLGRLVALKLLPERFSQDQARLQRFEREARVLAALSHPRIGAIHGLVEHEGRPVLALEWVEGPTLAERLKGGPLPVGQAVAIASELVEALEAAHERGVVHRDLKPANIVLSPSGLKVLDFGLAKAMGPDSPDPLSTLEARPGMVVGTVAYMSPEQARGERVDHRADIWAFGCIFVEMLSGTRAFPGTSAAAIMARVVEGQADRSGLPVSLPQPCATLVDRCLEPSPRRRLGWIGEARPLLVAALEPVTVARRSPSTLPHRWAPVAAALGLGVLAGGVAVWQTRSDPPPPVNRLAVPVPATDTLVAGDLPTVAIDPDGRALVYRARREGTMRLFRRELDRAEPTAIVGTEFAIGPFTSTDGRWVGFSRDGSLYRAPMAGGGATAVCAAAGSVAGAWVGEHIVFGGEATGGLFRVPADGGTPARLTTATEEPKEVHTFPVALPDRSRVLFTIARQGRSELAIVPLTGGTPQIIGRGYQAHLVADDVLVFLRDGTLWASRFSAARGTMEGEAVTLDERVDTSSVSGAGHIAVSRSGTMVYLPRRAERSRLRRLMWLDAQGNRTSVGIEPRAFTRAMPSPDGARIALSVSSPDNRDLWVFTTDRGILTRLTFDEAIDTAPIWTRDGRFIVFRSDQESPGLFVIRADGAEPAVRLTSSGKRIHTPYDVAADGAVLFTEFANYRDQRIGLVRPASPQRIEWLVDGPFADLRPRLSPDGRFLVYQSDESGRFEIFVRPYPDVNAARWQVTATGGTSPLWGRGGREIYYFRDGEIMKIPVLGGAAFGVGTPARVVGLDILFDRLGPVFELAPDGKRFLIIETFDAAPVPSSLALVTNWDVELRSRLDLR